MNLGNLMDYTRRFIKPAKKSRDLDDPVMTVLLNQAKDDIAARLKLYKKNKTFDLVADQGEYLISSITNDYLSIDGSGVYVLDDNDEFKRLDPYTRDKLDEEYPYWRDHASADALRYYVEANYLVFDPAPDTAATNGGKIYYAAKPPDMSLNTHYPFPAPTSQTVAIPQYTILDECIFEWMEWWVSKVILENEDAKVTSKRQHYEKSVEDKRILLYGRADILAHQDTLMRGPTVC